MTTPVTLRVCAVCEWIFRARVENEVYIYECPKCGQGSYSARYVYGAKCYGYEKNQKPWLIKKLRAYEAELEQIVKENWDQTESKKQTTMKLKLVK
jgi:hypothetical protein